MDTPLMLPPRTVLDDTTVMMSVYPIPFLGNLPVNAFLIHAEQPVLVDTGVPALRADFMRTLGSVIDLRDIRWLYLTHTDPDHMGSYLQVLTEAPHARVITTFAGMGKMGVWGLPIDRVYLLNPGQSLDVGDRELQCFVPPTLDAPETTGFFDTKTQALFCADTFGAVLDVWADTAERLEPDALRKGLITWATLDSPWLHLTDEAAFTKTLDQVRDFDPSVVLSSHLPPASGITDRLLEYTATARGESPFVGPDQSVLEQALAGII